MPDRQDKGAGPERRVSRPTQAGVLVVVSGPSGVGKSTICKEVVKRLPSAFLSISCTTRPPGPGEVNGKDYWFISRDQFEQGIAQGRFLEYAEVFGNLYGTPREPIEQALGQGKVVILEIDVQGARQVKQVFPGALLVFIMPPKDVALKQRLQGRARDDQTTIERRLRQAQQEIEAAKGLYQYFIVNDDLDKTVDEVIAVISKIAGQALVENSDDRGSKE
ncbi:MAG: guanylate kinase [Sedimentisphaerales bacterium]|nr:guanylate kinase [Sedimentisphaerales bacterium]